MTLVRPSQLTLIDGVAPVPVGPVATSVVFGDNAALMAAVAPLYLAGDVLDLTYGEGQWWRRHRPTSLTTVDRYRPAMVRADFRSTPFASMSFDVVGFDPPYLPTHGAAAGAAGSRFRQRYGLTSHTPADVLDLYAGGMAEAARLARRWVLVKASDYTNGSRLRLGHVSAAAIAERVGLIPHDLYVLANGPGPGHAPDEQVRARRVHSYLLVYRVRRRRRRELTSDAELGIAAVERLEATT